MFLSCALGAYAALAFSTSSFCLESCALYDRCCCSSISLGKCQSVSENASRCSSRAKAWNACLISRFYPCLLGPHPSFTPSISGNPSAPTVSNTPTTSTILDPADVP
ncbi:hypothetical protein AUEXF2481DRAFT_210144 [Aureobasidium subglaciale EXF-2481]|uniref:Extracellular membrane protein CFEM domain-containing protein n=1 Tax=Aureobasidium subglaciale (strain EXF-2481) TaxID=1043005 RepID=A0A074YBR2_AURSE|nr:uncharacterized protein AUEXF2481DRAFT_210144 [Aureobasidium subglaciale EXF-2481]KAI5193550.1 hypothetical protein E4T38_09898 [Aureobasidium subglaciale]KAI5213092.1 hypothetical protein E4T40_09909 [Aureobasidium subglaciale]KAI5214412.1 hypothetical protein E4T41_09904 [Aureobasidium subglaciale]KAI5252647.1 hypothetical protein E4T46_09893 [Aureobasidium subglaciale]KEQ95223.1 hypothetical protein AUEXF2481DRAFT_210144 [Aureobasidium subglaciale EXF-2481]